MTRNHRPPCQLVSPWTVNLLSGYIDSLYFLGSKKGGRVVLIFITLKFEKLLIVDIQ